MSIKEYEAANITPPLQNSNAMKCIGCLLADHTARSQDLSAMFRQLEDGHFLTIQADGAKIYVAFSPNTASTAIDERAVGMGPDVCYPIPDGVEKPIVPVGGQVVASGYGTTGLNFKVLQYMTGATGVTGYIRFYRSSLAPNQGPGEFKAP